MTTLGQLSSLELCAGAGGQALGVEWAGFRHEGAIEIDQWAIETLKLNRPSWNPTCGDVREIRGRDYRGIDLLAGGVPCPPFSVAGRQLGADDQRDLFPSALEWIRESKPRAVMLENVPGLASSRFVDYRRNLFQSLRRMGFTFVDGRVLNASDFGVPQLRPRFIIVALREPSASVFEWPVGIAARKTVGDSLFDLMSARGWKGAERWKEGAQAVAPTLVGGSKLHGGPDLGPTRAKAAWRALGVNGGGIADEAPEREFDSAGLPKLTLRMAARIQGFPDEWTFAGKKTAAYRQVGNAFPPPVAHAVSSAIASALAGRIATITEQRRLFAVAG